MRIYILWLLVIFFSLYSWKDWYKSLCFLIFLMAFVERPDMPKTLLNIPGFNPWNILFLNVVLAAFLDLMRSKYKPNIPPNITYIIFYYLLFILISYLREIRDISGIVEYNLYNGREPVTIAELTIDDVFNTIKYGLPGVLVLYGCNSASRARLIIFTLALMYTFIALQVIKVMPIHYLSSGDELQERAIRVIDRDIGYYRSDVAIFLGGAVWFIYSIKHIVRNKAQKIVVLISSILGALAVALTGGRIGQGAFLMLWMVLGAVKWRHLFFLAPIGLFVLIVMIPSVFDRFTQGFEYDPDDRHFSTAESEEEGKYKSITSGRTAIWPFVIDKIKDAPVFGYGRRAMQRTGLSLWLQENLQESFPHPHNAYLQLVLDNGMIVGIPLILFYLLTLKKSYILLNERHDGLSITVGVLGFTSIGSFLIGGIAQQSFYPVPSSVGMLVAMGLVIRVFNEKFNNGQVEKLEVHIGRTWNQERMDKEKRANDYYNI